MRQDNGGLVSEGKSKGKKKNNEKKWCKSNHSPPHACKIAPSQPPSNNYFSQSNEKEGEACTQALSKVAE